MMAVDQNRVVQFIIANGDVPVYASKVSIGLSLPIKDVQQELLRLSAAAMLDAWVQVYCDVHKCVVALEPITHEGRIEGFEGYGAEFPPVYSCSRGSHVISTDSATLVVSFSPSLMFRYQTDMP